jgi:3-deoxy-7-phosphoheptulonate synthase
MERSPSATKQKPANGAGRSRSIFGVMIDSHIKAGAHKLTPGKDDPSRLADGKSITDACLCWRQSTEALDVPAQAAHSRRG